MNPTIPKVLTDPSVLAATKCNNPSDLLNIFTQSANTLVWRLSAKNTCIDFNCVEVLMQGEDFLNDLLENPKMLEIEHQYQSEILELIADHAPKVASLKLVKDSPWWQYMLDHPNPTVRTAACENPGLPKKFDQQATNLKSKIEDQQSTQTAISVATTGNLKMADKRTKKNINSQLLIAALIMFNISTLMFIALKAEQPKEASAPSAIIAPSVITAPSSNNTLTLNKYKTAINLAAKITAQSKQAKTKADWAAVANAWNEPIKILEQISDEDSSYADAQAQISKYQVTQEIHSTKAK